MRSISFAGLVLGLLILAGCSQTTSGAGLLRPILPPLPSSLAASCTPPVDAALEDDTRILVGKAREAYGRCARRHRDLAAFYEGLRAGLR